MNLFGIVYRKVDFRFSPGSILMRIMKVQLAVCFKTIQNKTDKEIERKEKIKVNWRPQHFISNKFGLFFISLNYAKHSSHLSRQHFGFECFNNRLKSEKTPEIARHRHRPWLHLFKKSKKQKTCNAFVINNLQSCYLWIFLSFLIYSI